MNNFENLKKEIKEACEFNSRRYWKVLKETEDTIIAKLNKFVIEVKSNMLYAMNTLDGIPVSVDNNYIHIGFNYHILDYEYGMFGRKGTEEKYDKNAEWFMYDLISEYEVGHIGHHYVIEEN